MEPIISEGVIVKAQGPCQYEGCKQEETCIAMGRDGYRNQPAHPKISVYCEAHAKLVEDEGMPEYKECCQNCGLQYGVG